MSKILAEQLLAGIILGDNDNQEYIYPVSYTHLTLPTT